MEREDVSRIEKSWWRKVFERKVNGACMRDPRVVLRRNRLRNGGLRAISLGREEIGNLWIF